MTLGRVAPRGRGGERVPAGATGAAAGSGRGAQPVRTAGKARGLAHAVWNEVSAAPAAKRTMTARAWERAPGGEAEQLAVAQFRPVRRASSPLGLAGPA